MQTLDETEIVVVAIWPDLTFCEMEDLEEVLTFMSDDYEVKFFASYDDLYRYLDKQRY